MSDVPPTICIGDRVGSRILAGCSIGIHVGADRCPIVFSILDAISYAGRSDRVTCSGRRASRRACDLRLRPRGAQGHQGESD
jgi:hypothetical protein